MFPITREEGFEFQAFKCILIDCWDLSVKVLFSLKRDLEGLENKG